MKRYFENYKANSEDVERFKKISTEDIELRMDCTILSGPHNDKTGPCYCIDDHDHEIKILHMQDVLDAFESHINSGAVILSSGETYDQYKERLSFERNTIFMTEDGFRLIVNSDAKESETLIDNVMVIQDELDEEGTKIDIEVLAVTKDVERSINKHGYVADIFDITFDTIEIPVSAEMITLPKSILAVNRYATQEFLCSGSETVFRRYIK